MGEITFVRHGQASFGTANYDRLSDLGHVQAQWLGEHLNATSHGFDRVVSGTLRRHRETLSGIRQHFGVEDVIEDDRLNEMAYHHMESAFRADNPMPDPETGPEMEALFSKVLRAWEGDAIEHTGESFAAFQSRILAAIDEHSIEGSSTLFISSGGPKGILLRHVLGFDISALTEMILKTYNASYTTLEVQSGGYRLQQFNAIPHLESKDRSHAKTLI